MSLRLLPIVLVVLYSLSGRAEPRRLPLPLAKGGYAGFLGPAPLSGPLGFHVRGTLWVAPGVNALVIGGQFGLSMSFVYGEAGASFFGSALLAQDATPVQQRGPVEVWMRLGPFYPVGNDRSGLVLAAFGEYAVARAEVDAGGTVIPETTTLGLIAGWHRGFSEAYLSGAYQRALGVEAQGVTYHGAQLGGALWLRFFGALQAGAEALVRSGCFAGTPTCRPGAMGLIGLRALDRHGVGGGFAAGLGFGEDMPAWVVMARLGFTVGHGFKPPPREHDLEQDLRAWLAMRARSRALQAQRRAAVAQQHAAAQQATQATAQQQRAQAPYRQTLAQALARRYPLGGQARVSPVCVRRPCLVAGWRFDEQLVDKAVLRAWPQSSLGGIAQSARPPWRPPTRPPVRVVPLPGSRPGRTERRSMGERVAETPPGAFRPLPPPYHQPTIDVQGAPPRPASWREREAEHARPPQQERPQQEPPPPERPQQQVAEHAPPQTQVRWNQKRSDHIFRDKEGHLPRNEANKEKWIMTFIDVASNPANLRPDAVRASLTTSFGAGQAGLRAYTQILPSGEQVWVTVRSGEIQDAGVNLPGNHR